jgi:outer membrane protein, heavy metal efflux system
MWTRSKSIRICVCAAFALWSAVAGAEDAQLKGLIEEALKNNPEVLAAQSRADAAKYRIPQAKSLPDPMVMFGYQNEGWNDYTLGTMPDAQWMFSASQMFPFPGKRSLKGEMAEKEAQSLFSEHQVVLLATVAKVKELYYDLFFAHKNIELLQDKGTFLSRIEDAALARYSSGMGMQQEVLMAQAEKYMLMEKEEMQKQKIQALEGMLNSAVGRSVTAPVPRPQELTVTPSTLSVDALVEETFKNSPELRAKEEMRAAAEARVQMARKEYYPDFTINAGVSKRRGMFDDMWSLTSTINIPLYYRSRQRQALFEAESSLSAARCELDAAKLMLSSALRDNSSMLSTADRLMELYKNALIPKTYQDFESALAGYESGQVEPLTVITRLRALLDYELLYWDQLVQREKAVAKLEAIAGTALAPSGSE